VQPPPSQNSKPRGKHGKLWKKTTRDKWNPYVPNWLNLGPPGIGSREAVFKVLTESEQRVKADMAEIKRFSNYTHDYIKTKMTTSDFDQALIDGWEIVLQSPDGYVLLRKAKV